MIIEYMPQQGEEWLEAKKGIPSASNFDKIIKANGQPSAQAERYMFDLAMERLRGRKESYTNRSILAGIEREPESRDYYSLINGVDIEEVGLVYFDERKLFCCSPDGLYLPDRKKGLELKNPEEWTHYQYMQNPEKLLSDYHRQVHGSLAITGAKEWDIMSYCPPLKEVIVTVKRDQAFCATILTEVVKFCLDLDKLTDELRQ